MINHLEPKRVDRVFLDANVLFSAGYKSISSLRTLWELTDVELLTSSYAVEEAHRNLAIHKPDQLESLEQLLDALIVVAEPAEGLSLPAEVDLVEKDRPILLAAIAARATHLLTGDKDHFGTYFGQTIGGVLILRPRDYLSSRPEPPTARV
jgi:predicted nucleic acid-binding protein